MVYNWLSSSIMPLIISYAIALIALLIGSITDLRTREVPDWVNYGLIMSGIALNLLFSIIYSNFSFIINSIAGLSIFFGIAYLMFYTGQWGGGDSKILMGLGAIIGVDFRFITGQFLFSFFINALFVGAIYGLFWSFFLAVKNRKKFWKVFNKILSSHSANLVKKIIIAFVIFSIFSFFYTKLFFVKILMLSFVLMVLTTFYLWIFVKSVEKCCMYKLVEPSKLTEGDWIVNNIYVNKQYICGPKDLGIEKKQIRKLIEFYKKGKVRKILIKEGIPFVPSFLIAFVVTFLFGNPLLWMI